MIIKSQLFFKPAHFTKYGHQKIFKSFEKPFQKKDDAPLLLRCVFVVVNGLVTSLYEKNPTILVPGASLASREHTKTLRFRSFTQKFSGN